MSVHTGREEGKGKRGENFHLEIWNSYTDCLAQKKKNCLQSAYKNNNSKKMRVIFDVIFYILMKLWIDLPWE